MKINSIQEQLTLRSNELKNRIINSGLATSTTIKGCSEEEISILEKTSGLLLPYSYKVFLQNFGHSLGGRVMNDIEISYNSAFSLMNDLKELRSDGEEPEFPPNTFFFSTRYKEQYLFFILDEVNDDPPVFHFHVDRDYFRRSCNSIFDVLEEEIGLSEYAVSKRSKQNFHN